MELIDIFETIQSPSWITHEFASSDNEEENNETTNYVSNTDTDNDYTSYSFEGLDGIRVYNLETQLQGKSLEISELMTAWKRSEKSLIIKNNALQETLEEKITTIQSHQEKLKKMEISNLSLRHELASMQTYLDSKEKLLMSEIELKNDSIHTNTFLKQRISQLEKDLDTTRDQLNHVYRKDAMLEELKGTNQEILPRGRLLQRSQSVHSILNDLQGLTMIEKKEHPYAINHLISTLQEESDRIKHLTLKLNKERELNTELKQQLQHISFKQSVHKQSLLHLSTISINILPIAQKQEDTRIISPCDNLMSRKPYPLATIHSYPTLLSIETIKHAEFLTSEMLCCNPSCKQRQDQLSDMCDTLDSELLYQRQMGHRLELQLMQLFDAIEHHEITTQDLVSIPTTDMLDVSDSERATIHTDLSSHMIGHNHHGRTINLLNKYMYTLNKQLQQEMLITNTIKKKLQCQINKELYQYFDVLHSQTQKNKSILSTISVCHHFILNNKQNMETEMIHPPVLLTTHTCVRDQYVVQINVTPNNLIENKDQDIIQETHQQSISIDIQTDPVIDVEKDMLLPNHCHVSHVPFQIQTVLPRRSQSMSDSLPLSDRYGQYGIRRGKKHTHLKQSLERQPLPLICDKKLSHVQTIESGLHDSVSDYPEKKLRDIEKYSIISTTGLSLQFNKRRGRHITRDNSTLFDTFTPASSSSFSTNVFNSTERQLYPSPKNDLILKLFHQDKDNKPLMPLHSHDMYKHDSHIIHSHKDTMFHENKTDGLHETISPYRQLYHSLSQKETSLLGSRESTPSVKQIYHQCHHTALRHKHQMHRSDVLSRQTLGNDTIVHNSVERNVPVSSTDYDYDNLFNQTPKPLQLSHNDNQLIHLSSIPPWHKRSYRGLLSVSQQSEQYSSSLSHNQSYPFDSQYKQDSMRHMVSNQLTHNNGTQGLLSYALDALQTDALHHLR